MTNNTNGFSTDIRVNGEKLDCVNRFKYLGATITDEGSKPEILARIAQATAALAKLKTIWIEEVRNRTRQAIGPHEDLLTTVKQRKLRWYGHITRSSGLVKMVMQGIVQGGRRRGRQRKRWEANIPEWTGLTLGAAMRKAERQEEWRELVAKSSVVPQRSTETTG